MEERDGGIYVEVQLNQVRMFNDLIINMAAHVQL